MRCAAGTASSANRNCLWRSTAPWLIIELDRDAKTFAWIGAPFRSRQYASAEYVAILKQHAMVASMSRHRTRSSSVSREAAPISTTANAQNAIEPRPATSLELPVNFPPTDKNGSCKNYSDETSLRQTPENGGTPSPVSGESGVVWRVLEFVLDLPNRFRCVVGKRKFPLIPPSPNLRHSGFGLLGMQAGVPGKISNL